MKVAVTGHRPNKLWGYDYTHHNYIKLGKVMRDILNTTNATYIISGMALGVDTVFALVGLKLGVLIECAIPCANQSSKWFGNSVKLYNDILASADVVTYVSDKPYTPQCMQLRNQYMVDNCDMLIAVWDGSPGGTANCVRYAKHQGKNIVYINPVTLVNDVDGYNTAVLYVCHGDE